MKTHSRLPSTPSSPVIAPEVPRAALLRQRSTPRSVERVPIWEQQAPWRQQPGVASQRSLNCSTAASPKASLSAASLTPERRSSNAAPLAAVQIDGAADGSSAALGDAHAIAVIAAGNEAGASGGRAPAAELDVLSEGSQHGIQPVLLPAAAQAATTPLSRSDSGTLGKCYQPAMMMSCATQAHLHMVVPWAAGRDPLANDNPFLANHGMRGAAPVDISGSGKLAAPGRRRAAAHWPM